MERLILPLTGAELDLLKDITRIKQVCIQEHYLIDDTVAVRAWENYGGLWPHQWQELPESAEELLSIILKQTEVQDE